MLSRIIAAVGMALVTTAHAAALDAENTLVLELKDGPVVIELLPDVAPKHVERVKTLAKQGFYDNVAFHRVIPGFMAQTGDPTGTGAGGSDLPDLKAEFSKTPHVRGVVSMARTNDPNTANSQFFIVFDDASFLDGKYTVFGRVVDGMDHVDKIKAGTQANNGAVKNPDRIVRAYVGLPH